MTFKYSTKVRNARLDAIRTVIGPAPIMKFFARLNRPLSRMLTPKGYWQKFTCRTRGSIRPATPS